jgi:hypothetical protein
MRSWLYLGILAVGVVPLLHLLVILSIAALTPPEPVAYWYSDLPQVSLGQ